MARGRTDQFASVEQTGRLDSEVPDELPWLKEAALLYDSNGYRRSGRRLVRLVAWFDRNTYISLPWCGLFVGHCIRAAMPEEPLPPLYIRARPWRSFGVACEPQLGALLIFWLRWKNSPFGHVGFYWGEDEENFHVLGGNQHRSILVERFPKHRLIDCRWPPGMRQPHLRRVHPPDKAQPFEYTKIG